MTLLQAIAHMEGWYVLGSRPRRNNNPGDLIWGAEAQAFGALHGDPRFAVFGDARTGWRALKRWLSVPSHLHAGPIEGLFFDSNGTTLVGGYLGATIAQVFHRFAPPVENATDHYIATICQNVGVTPGTILTQALLVSPEVI